MIRVKYKNGPIDGRTETVRNLVIYSGKIATLAVDVQANVKIKGKTRVVLRTALYEEARIWENGCHLFYFKGLEARDVKEL